ncbi:hypothetical protein CRENBAI_012070, partial [Crenichthys baileyi]
QSSFSRVTKAIETTIQIALMETIVKGSTITSNEDDQEDFFSSITRFQESRSHTSLKSKVQKLVKTWLEAGSNKILSEVAFWLSRS